MLIALRWVLAASVGAALLAALLRGWGRRVPVFCCYLAVQLPVLIGYHPESHSWLWSVWVPLEPVIVLLRVGIAIEAFRVHCTEKKALLGWSLAGLSLMLALFAWRALPHEAQPIIVQPRRYAQIFAASFVLLYVALIYSQSLLRVGWQQRHLLIVTLILLNHGAISVASLTGDWPNWWTVSEVSFAVASAGYLAWAVLCPLSLARDLRADLDGA